MRTQRRIFHQKSIRKIRAWAVAHFFVSPKNFMGRRFFFDRSESRHLSLVLRKRPGDTIRVFNGEGIVQNARLLEVSNPERVTGELLDSHAAPGRSSLRPEKIKTLDVYPAVLKGPRFDWMLEKLTELAVNAIHPILTERTVVRLKPQESASKIRRWEKIILSAAKQCGRKNFAKVYPPVNFQEAVSSLPKDYLNLILWESEEKKSISETLDEKTKKCNSGVCVNLLVGPEGGLTVKEAELAARSGVLPVHLGENILRAETAAIAGAAYILLS